MSAIPVVDAVVEAATLMEMDPAEIRDAQYCQHDGDSQMWLEFTMRDGTRIEICPRNNC